jgi:hypothetical protein
MITFPPTKRQGGNSDLVLDVTAIPGALLIGAVISLVFIRRRQKTR